MVEAQPKCRKIRGILDTRKVSDTSVAGVQEAQAKHVSWCGIRNAEFFLYGYLQVWIREIDCPWRANRGAGVCFGDRRQTVAAAIVITKIEIRFVGI